MDVKPVYLPVDLINRWLAHEVPLGEDLGVIRSAMKRTRNHPLMQAEK